MGGEDDKIFYNSPSHSRHAARSHKIQKKCFYNYNIYYKILKIIWLFPHLILVPARVAGLLLLVVLNSCQVKSSIYCPNFRWTHKV